jgi:hypothetical protein
MLCANRFPPAPATLMENGALMAYPVSLAVACNPNELSAGMEGRSGSTAPRCCRADRKCGREAGSDHSARRLFGRCCQARGSAWTRSSLPALTQDEVRVRAWAEVREPLELQLAPLGRRALVALEPRPGESVLDIGCGGGETALDLAQAIAPDGTVVGVDLSAAVLAFARRAAEGCERVQFVQADAQAFPFARAARPIYSQGNRDMSSQKDHNPVKQHAL